ncbi:hypothetical protein HDV06_003917 [Boothiomyces sp. JEL0866]|nr:hypothetical protein HDV06_003917 [Boothiomyces sp. JEL0866]
MLKHLSQLKKPQLTNLCLTFGLPITGTRQTLIDQILQQSKAVNIPKNIIAIDVGTTNIGYVHIESQPLRIIEWKLIDPRFPKCFDIVKYSQILNDVIPKSDAQYIIEKQSYRLGARIPYAILKTNSIEAILSGLFVNQVESIPPQLISKFFDLPKSDYKQKKKKTVQLVSDWIENQKFEISVNHVQLFRDTKKKDDLSDCLLLAYAYHQWKLNIIEFTETFQFCAGK